MVFLFKKCFTKNKKKYNSEEIGGVNMKISATEKTIEVVKQLKEKYGELIFEQSAGCCDGTAPMCFEKKGHYLSSQMEQVGEIEGELYAFSGIHMISPLLVRTTMDSWPPSFSIMDYYLSVCADYDIHIDVQPNLRLLDVGKTASLAEAQQMLRTLSPDRNPQ